MPQLKILHAASNIIYGIYEINILFIYYINDHLFNKNK